MDADAGMSCTGHERLGRPERPLPSPCPAPAQQRAGPAASSEAPGGPAFGGSPARLPSAPRTRLASGFSPPSRARCSDASLTHRRCLGFRVGEAGEAGDASFTRAAEQGPPAGLAWAGSWQRGDGKNCGIVLVWQAKDIEAHLL